jgi:hypothetical protein
VFVFTSVFFGVPSHTPFGTHEHVCAPDHVTCPLHTRHRSNNLMRPDMEPCKWQIDVCHALLEHNCKVPTRRPLGTRICCYLFSLHSFERQSTNYSVYRRPTRLSTNYQPYKGGSGLRFTRCKSFINALGFTLKESVKA